MIKFDLLLKRMWTVLAVLFCTVVSAQAAAITYQLTTHVDGRTITATANLNAGDNLNDKMPQTLWRGYTTYKYYSDAALTQEITEAPANGGTVYVDYEFDPPFLMSEEGQEPVYNYLRCYDSNTHNYIVYYKQSAENEWGSNPKTIMSWDSANSPHTPTVGNNNAMAKAGHDQWAFYGDGYDFQIRLNDSSIANNYLIWRSTTGREVALGLGAKPEVGWQLYVNTASNTKLSGGTIAMGPYNSTNYLAELWSGNSYLRTNNLNTPEQYFDEHNQLVAKQGGLSETTMNKKGLWWYAFFASPTTLPYNTTDIWHVTYKIQKADGTWYDDIVVQKRSNNLTPTWPVAGFEPVEGYEYDYFYTDATFTEKFQGAMPNDCNTTLYIKETAPVVPVIYYVTYKIQKADGTWYDDIIEEKNDNNLTPTWPVTGFTPVEGYEYDYFYTDATFAEKLEGAMPADCNSTLFIKETEPITLFQRNFTVGKWMTLVLPDYNILPQNGIYGRFLDYVAVESKENATDGYHWDCDLKFQEVGPNDLVPNRPYLYLPTEIEGTDDNVRNKVISFPLEGTPLTVSHVDANQPDVTVTMYGTYEDFELVPCEPVEPKGYKYIYFYFGNPAEDVYNFYTVERTVTIAPTICYFDIKATKNADPTIGGFGAKFSFFDGTNAISNIEGVKKNNDKIYNLNGQQVQGNLQKGIYIVNGKKVLVK